MRAAAVWALEALNLEPRLSIALPLIDDPVRLVRIRAARVLAPVPDTSIPAAERERVGKGFREYIASELANSDRPSAHVNLGLYFTERRRFEEAEAAYRTALRLSPRFTRAHVNLADLYRLLGRDEEGEGLLRQALEVAPENGAVHHALGLNLIRRKKTEEAMQPLETAARLSPEVPGFSYVHAVALHSTGKVAEALAMLAKAHGRTPGDRNILTALATMHRDRGDHDKAVGYAKKLVELSPRDQGARALLSQLEAMRDR